MKLLWPAPLMLISALAIIGIHNQHQRHPDIDRGAVNGKVDCLEIRAVMESAHPDFRPPVDTIEAIFERCQESNAGSQDSLSSDA